VVGRSGTAESVPAEAGLSPLKRLTIRDGKDLIFLRRYIYTCTRKAKRAGEDGVPAQPSSKIRVASIKVEVLENG
jgi:hypothetical protein